MLDVTEEAVGDGLGQVAEPDIAERGVVRETLDSEEEGIDNALQKSLVPFTMCQNVLPASRGDEICLYDELFPGGLCMHPHRQRKDLR
jgi:hypothetical protein